MAMAFLTAIRATKLIKETGLRVERSSLDSTTSASIPIGHQTLSREWRNENPP